MDRAAEGTRHAKAHVVDQDDEHIGRATGALISKNGGALTLRASSSVTGG